MSNKNQDEWKGRAKEAAGDLTDDEELKGEGKADRATGEVKDAVDSVREKADEAVKSVREHLDSD